MLWSSFSDSGYAMGLARSESGGILGPWIQQPEPLVDRDSGHGMAFHTLDGRLMLSWHSPNATPLERPVFFEAKENKDGITLSHR